MLLQDVDSVCLGCGLSALLHPFDVDGRHFSRLRVERSTMASPPVCDSDLFPEPPSRPHAVMFALVNDLLAV